MKIGLDIGSTTIKCVVLNDEGKIAYQSYERHFSQITQKLSLIHIFDEHEAHAMEPTACIRCGRCVTGCPMNLVPSMLEKYTAVKDTEALNRYGISTCMAVSYTHLQEADERATNSLLYSLLMGSYSFGGRLAPINDMPINDKLFLIQADIIKEKAAEGSCIFVGRCADYILRDRPNVLNVFIHADRQSRIDRVINHYAEVDRQNASDFLNKKDKHRSNYYNFYTNQRWGDFSNYQLVLNSATFGIENCVSLIQQAASAMEISHSDKKEP